MKSQTLSGCPSETDSDVNVYVCSLILDVSQFPLRTVRTNDKRPADLSSRALVKRDLDGCGQRGRAGYARPIKSVKSPRLKSVVNAAAGVKGTTDVRPESRYVPQCPSLDGRLRLGPIVKLCPAVARAGMRALEPPMPRFKLRIDTPGTRYSGWQIQKNARTVQGEIDRAVREVTGERDVRAVRRGPHRRGRPRPRPGRASRRPHVAAAGIAAAPRQRRAARRHPRARARPGAAPVPRPPRRGLAHLHLPDARAPHGLRQALRLVGRRRLAWRRDAARRAPLQGAAGLRVFTDDDPDEKSTLVEVAAVALDEAGDLLLVRVEGSHFLWKMVRRMIGVLVEVGRGGARPRGSSIGLREPSRRTRASDRARFGPVSRARRLPGRSRPRRCRSSPADGCPDVRGAEAAMSQLDSSQAAKASR